MRMDFSLVGLVGCFSDWILTRPWGKVALCFLPLAFALSTIGLVAGSSWLDRNKLADRYLKIADQEVAAWEKQWAPEPGAKPADADATQDSQAVGNAAPDSSTADSSTANSPSRPTAPAEIPASAEMLFRRVQQLQENDARSMFFVAMCYLQRGAGGQAFNMFNRIAPDDRIGYLPAHTLIIESMLARPPIRDIERARHHAQAAMLWDRAPPQLLALIGQLFTELGEKDLALRALRLAADRDPTFHYLLAQVAKREEKTKKLAEESLNKAVAHFSVVLQKEPQNTKARIMLADVYRMQDDWSQAEKTLLDGLARQDDPTLKTALSEVYRFGFAKTSRFDGKTWSGDLELLEKAYRLDPNNLRIYDEVAALAALTGKVASEELMAQLRKNLAAGSATSVTHVWIAEHYLRTNEFAKAVPHLEQAVQRDPTAARSWNNLAHCLADLDATRLEEALECVDKAIALTAQSGRKVPEYYDTRGSILMKLKRPGPAIAAFEQAIESVARSGGKSAPNPSYHLQLAEAYAAAGDASMANTHREFAASLAKEIEKARADKEAARQSQPPTNTEPVTPPDSATVKSPDKPADKPAESTPASPPESPAAVSPEGAPENAPAKPDDASAAPPPSSATEPD